MGGDPAPSVDNAANDHTVTLTAAWQPGWADVGAVWPSSDSGLTWTRRETASPDGVAGAVLAEASRGHDLVVLGAGEPRHGAGLFGPVADAVVRASPCSVFVLRAPGWRLHGGALRRILLPTTGTRADRRGAEFALALARGAGAQVVALNVVESRTLADGLGAATAEEVRNAAEAGRHATDAVARLGAAMGVAVETDVRVESWVAAGEEIVHRAETDACDLILLAAEPRPAGGELYCGRTVAQVLRRARCPVAVLFAAAPAAGATADAGAGAVSA